MDINLKVGVELSPPEFSESSFLRDYKGEITNSLTGAHVGKVRAFILAAEQCEDYGYSPLDSLNTTQASACYMELLSLKEAGNFVPSVLRILQEDFVFSRNMLIIDRIEVLPRYRGRGFGLQAMHLMLMHLSADCRIAAIKPYPLQFESQRIWDDAMGLGTLPKGKKAATTKLKSHYAKLDFKSVGRSGLMIRDLAQGTRSSGKNLGSRASDHVLAPYSPRTGGKRPDPTTKMGSQIFGKKKAHP